ncbi:hypothetical protein [Streptomyces sp. NPDC058739]|uniref:hypothetical protein n=1 Tax=Streptomyces sp. NPDC058739 TaxID=3346618 RepID=UPI0036C36BFB
MPEPAGGKKSLQEILLSEDLTPGDGFWVLDHVVATGADGSVVLDTRERPPCVNSSMLPAIDLGPGQQFRTAAPVLSALTARGIALRMSLLPGDSAPPNARKLSRGAGGQGGALDEFTRRNLVLPRGPRWREAVSSALLGDWIAPLESGGSIDAAVLGQIKAEARTIHRQLVPLWRHRVRGSRVLQLEAPLGDNLTLRDLVAGELRMDDLVFETVFDNPRLSAVLDGLTEAEHAVAMAWAHPTIATWTEAAQFAGAADPEALGERVRRKLKRLGARHTQRAAAARKTGAGL